MRPYEVMVIFDVDLEEADIRQRVDRVLDLVRAQGGTPGKVDHWGRRTFAYEMKHRNEGYYVLLDMLAEPATMAEIDRVLTLEDAALRHKIIRLPEHIAGRSGNRHQRRPSSGREHAGDGAKPAAKAAGAADIAAAAPEGVAEPAAN
jgi:small subunit ribosomal protein S6